MLLSHEDPPKTSKKASSEIPSSSPDVKSCLFIMSMQRCYRIIKEQHQTSIMASFEPSNNNYNEASRDVSQTTSGYIHFRRTLHVICLRINGMPYKSQSTPDLPSERVSNDPPFTHVGLDFAGPPNVVNRHANGSSKDYVCLFTCASTRAIHLELGKGLDVQEFLLAFGRFASRRGLTATITSDNAKTFKSSSKEIRRITRSNEVLRYLINQRISWNFIIERAPWWGGF